MWRDAFCARSIHGELRNEIVRDVTDRVVPAAGRGRIAARDVAARFVDVLRRDDLSILTQAVDPSQSDGRAWEEFRGIVDRYDCVRIDRYEWSIVSQSEDRLALHLRLEGTAALKAAWRPERRLPRWWNIEARYADGAWRIWRAVTEERRLATAMAAAPSAAEAENIARLGAGGHDVDMLELLAMYASELESLRNSSRLEHALSLARDTGDVSTEIIVLRSDALLAQRSGWHAGHLQACRGARTHRRKPG